MQVVHFVSLVCFRRDFLQFFHLFVNIGVHPFTYATCLDALQICTNMHLYFFFFKDIGVNLTGKLTNTYTGDRNVCNSNQAHV